MNNQMPKSTDTMHNLNNFSKTQNSNKKNFFASKNGDLNQFPNSSKDSQNYNKFNIDYDNNFEKIFNTIKASSFDTNSNSKTINNNADDNNNSNFFPNLDIGTILKIKSIMDKMNNPTHDPRSNLLLSLKPYLKPSRKEKIDQYIKIFNITQLFQDLNLNNGGEK